jgi:hypothetical protein
MSIIIQFFIFRGGHFDISKRCFFALAKKSLFTCYPSTKVFPKTLPPPSLTVTIAMTSSLSTTENVIIPWMCLQDQATKPPSSPTPSSVAKKTFSDAVNNVCDIPSSQFPSPVVKGDNIAISMPGDE